jgi:hypothetical protein
MKYIYITHYNEEQINEHTGQVPMTPMPWIKNRARECLYGYTKLSFFQRYVYDALARLRGRTAMWPPNDMAYLRLQFVMRREESPHLPKALRKIAEVGLISYVDWSDPNTNADGSPYEPDANVVKTPTERE